MNTASIPNVVSRWRGEDLFVKLPKPFLKGKMGRVGHECLKRSTYFHYLSSGLVPLQVISAWASDNELWEKAIAFCSRSKPPVKIPRKLDSELAYLVGALRDGSISKRAGVDYTLSLFQSGEGSYVWLRKISSIIRRQFDIAPKIEADRKGHRIVVHSKPVVLFFEHVFSMPMDQRYWDTPNLIKSGSAIEIGLAKGYVAGFFDAEGYVTSVETYRKTGKTKLAFYQNNRESLEFIRAFLTGLGFRPSFCKDRGKFALYLYGKEALANFYAQFPVLRKKKRLRALLGSF